MKRNQGAQAIAQSLRILANSKNKVYITNQTMNTTDAFVKLFLGQDTHAGKGGYLVAFKLNNYQRANLSWHIDSPFEYVHQGTLKIDPNNIIYIGPNGY